MGVEAGFDDNPEKAYGHYLIALDLVTGKPRGRKIKIEGGVEGGGYAAAGIYAVTKGVEQDESHSTVEASFAKNLAAIEVVNRNDDRKWRVTDTIRKNDKDYVRFNSAMQLQRPGLLLLKGTIYSAFGARADQDPYHGWVFAHAADTLELKRRFLHLEFGLGAAAARHNRRGTTQATPPRSWGEGTGAGCLNISARAMPSRTSYAELYNVIGSLCTLRLDR